ncbi:MAG TPA: DUF4402 domain-containing protein [Balneolaceae bacterium]
MKRTLYLLSTFALVLTFTTGAFAQTEVTASTSIVADLVIAKKADLDFGQISNSQTVDAVIDPQTGNSNTGSTTTLGKITVDGSNGASITISFSNPATLDKGTDTITFTGNYASNDTDDSSTSTDLDEGAANTVTLDSTDGIEYIYLGGTLLGNDINGATVGAYTGTITVNISYL